MRPIQRLACLATLGVLAFGCATPAGVLKVRERLRKGSVASALEIYERLRARGRPEAGQALREIAGATVVRAALAPQRRSRGAAFRALETLGGDEAEPLYERIFRRGELAARSRAAEGLLRNGDETGVRVLRRALGSPDGEVRAAGVSWLAVHGRWRRIRGFTLDLDSDVRDAAIRALSNAPMDGKTVACLREALRVDPSPRVRADAARALGRAGDAGVDPLVAALEDRSLGVRSAALTSLARLKTPSALDRVERIASGEATAEGTAAAAALASAGQKRGVAYLRRSMRSSDGELRRQAVAAGGRLSALRPDVIRLLDDLEPGVRLRAALALRSLPAQRRKATSVLRALLRAGGPEALQAAVALAEDGDTRARRRLRAALASASTSERGLAVRALGERLGEPAAVRRSLLDPDPGVRVAAARAILR